MCGTDNGISVFNLDPLMRKTRVGKAMRCRSGYDFTKYVIYEITKIINYYMYLYINY